LKGYTITDQPQDFSTLSPEQATTKLNELTAAFKGALPPENLAKPAEAQAPLSHLANWAFLFTGGAAACGTRTAISAIGRIYQ
jgi:hypothetical protein